MGTEIIDKNFICFVFAEYYFLFLQTEKQQKSLLALVFDKGQVKVKKVFDENQ